MRRETCNENVSNLYPDGSPMVEKRFVEILFASFFTVLRFINTTVQGPREDRVRSRRGEGGGLCRRGGWKRDKDEAAEGKGLSYFRATPDKSLNLVYKQIPQYREREGRRGKGKGIRDLMATRGRSSRKPPLKCNLLRKDYSPRILGSDEGETPFVQGRLPNSFFTRSQKRELFPSVSYSLA